MHEIIDLLEFNLWKLGFVFIIVFGLYLTFLSGFFQIRKFPAILRLFYSYFHKSEDSGRGIHPLKAFFASIGGAIGIGNVVAVCTAVQLAGPGAVFWIWVAGFLGMMIKYGEIYLGLLYRVENSDGSYDGGPMYFLKKAYGSSFFAIFVCLLLCVYGTEIFMFSVMTHSMSVNWGINQFFVMISLLVMILFACRGGLERVGSLCSAIVPIFVGLFSLMSLFVIFENLSQLPQLLRAIFEGAFKGSAPIGFFAGSSVFQCMAQGIARGCYSGDVGVGYASIIHSESKLKDPARQSSLAIFGIFLDTFVVCSFSLFLVLLTGVWKDGISADMMVQEALAKSFPFMQYFMPFFLLLLGYSTMISFFAVGLKCAHFLSPRFGKNIYYVYAVIVLIYFSYAEQGLALSIMSLCGVLLLMINLTAIFLLRKELSFILK